MNVTAKKHYNVENFKILKCCVTCLIHIWPKERTGSILCNVTSSELTLTATILLDGLCLHLYTVPRTPSPRTDNVAKSAAEPPYVSPLIVRVSSTGNLCTKRGHATVMLAAEYNDSI